MDDVQELAAFLPGHWHMLLLCTQSMRLSKLGEWGRWIQPYGFKSKEHERCTGVMVLMVQCAKQSCMATLSEH